MNILPGFSKWPKTYETLCHLRMPRTLHDEIELVKGVGLRISTNCAFQSNGLIFAGISRASTLRNASLRSS